MSGILIYYVWEGYIATYTRLDTIKVHEPEYIARSMQMNIVTFSLDGTYSHSNVIREEVPSDLPRRDISVKRSKWEI
jgi:hypothetical protein